MNWSWGWKKSAVKYIISSVVFFVFFYLSEYYKIKSLYNYMNLLSFLCPGRAVTDHTHMQELFVWWGFLFSTWNLSAADARKVCAFMSLTGWFLHTSFRTSSCFASVLPKWADPGKSSLCQLGFSQRHSYWLIHTWVKHKTENWLDFFFYISVTLGSGWGSRTNWVVYVM